jgi:hypothetical protein
MDFVSTDFAADRMTAPGILALILSDDKSEGYMTAKSDRDELDKALNKVKLAKDMSIDNFKVLYNNALGDYNECSSVAKYADTQAGVEEEVEQLLLMLGDGDLKSTVASKFDKLRASAEMDQTERPGIDKFWEVLHRAHAVLEHHRLRAGTVSNSNKRLRDEGINTLNVDVGAPSGVCFRFQKGTCTRGSKCPFAHVNEPAVKKVQFAISDRKGKGKGKGRGKPVHEVNIPFKGSKGVKGLQGRGKGKGNDKGGGKGKGSRDSQLVYCNRCEVSHHGATGKMCVMPPCRYCLATKMRSLPHHLKDCRQRPPEWEFQPDMVSPGETTTAESEGQLVSNETSEVNTERMA